MSRKSLVVDTNLLLLIIIGAIDDGRHIKSSDRLNKFSVDDYHLVIEFISNYEKIYISQYIAAEVSNLIDLHSDARISAFGVARALFTEFCEVSTTITDDVKSKNFLIFGITDNSLISLASNYSILTDDNRLLRPLYEAGGDYIFPFEVIKTLKNAR